LITTSRRTADRFGRRTRERNGGRLILHRCRQLIRVQAQDSLKLLKLPRIELQPPLVEPTDSLGVMLLS
jgi:hypothetical protein